MKLNPFCLIGGMMVGGVFLYPIIITGDGVPRVVDAVCLLVFCTLLFWCGYLAGKRSYEKKYLEVLYLELNE